MEDSGYRVHVHHRSGTTEHALSEGRELVFGRDPACTVPCADESVSRRHAVLRLKDRAIHFEDLGSRSGSVVDGESVPANLAIAVKATSVIRIGEAVVVLEVAPSGAQPHCADAQTFERKAAELLGSSESAGLIEVLAESTSLPQMLGRIVGLRGLIGDHVPGRLLLVLDDTDEERLDASASLVKRICDDHGASVQVRTSACAATLEAMLAQLAHHGGAALVPPVIFAGALRAVEGTLAKLERNEATVLIVGEKGAGKDVLARAIHLRSRRTTRPFVSSSCRGVTDRQLEELLEAASGGTLFLQEISALSASQQAKLLRASLRRAGNRETDVRFVLATCRDPKKLRGDLSRRAGNVTLRLLPLRERVEEIAPLALHFVDAAAKRLGRLPPRLLAETRALLESHRWPGNVRELENVIDLAVLVQKDGTIRPADIHIESYTPAEGA